MAAILSHPHPVLGNSDDVQGSFEPTLKVDLTRESVTIHVAELATNNPTVAELLEQGRAAFVVRVECGRTYFRESYIVTTEECSKTIAASRLRDLVEVSVSIVARERLTGYRPAGIHPDYGAASFTLEVGAVLALGPAWTFSADKHFDPGRAVMASLFRVSKGDHEAGPFRVDWSDELVHIQLSAEQWQRYNVVKDQAPSVLHAALVLPVLVEAIALMPEHEGHLWQSRLQQIIASHEGADEHEPLMTAQLLLADPLNRALVDFDVQEDD